MGDSGIMGDMTGSCAQQCDEVTPWAVVHGGMMGDTIGSCAQQCDEAT